MFSLSPLAAALFRAPADGHPPHPRHGPSRQCIESALAELRFSGRRAVRILDLGCGAGDRLLHAAAFARSLGFVAIEARGTDLSALRIRQARAHAREAKHPSTSIRFDLAEPIAALAAEHDGDADLILLSQPLPYRASPLALALDRVAAGPVLTAR
ncbi:methyltransferase domain-containing protein [Sphingomonas sp. MMS12-HWE2-04]|uniref:methyltransferase domain-containing protein n=1 Tax=Sphingomonas sp. MMS12-HWE2-04 TaxID=3234199 RepID=UPI00384FBDB4